MSGHERSLHATTTCTIDAHAGNQVCTTLFFSTNGSIAESVRNGVSLCYGWFSKWK